MVLSTGEDNKHQRYGNFMFKHVTMDKECRISTDNDTCFMWMKDYVELENSRVDHQDRNHKMKWLNLVVSNFENNIRNIYNGLCKRNLPLLSGVQV